MTTSRTKTSAAVYCRISKDSTGEGAGVERQRAACMELAASRGWSIDPANVYIENDTSATTGRRPKYDRMIAAAEAGNVSVIIAWHVDRLTRKVTEIEDLIALSERTGVKVTTVSGDLDLTTDSGRLVGRILASVARGEVERKGARQRAANLQRAEDGKPPHTGRAFGYDLDGTIRPDEAEVVRELYTRFAAGAGLHTLVTWLSDTGQLNTRGKAWTRAGVRDLLQNPRYIAERWILRGYGKDRVREYVGPGAWEPIVSEDTFRAVASILAEPSRREKYGRNGNVRKYWGAACFRCGVCGSLVKTNYGSIKHKDGSTVVYRKYLCAEKWCVSRRADYIDEYVEAVICARLRDPRIVAAMATEQDAGAVRKLRDEANTLRSRIDGLAGDYADGLLTARQVKVATDRAEARLREVESRLADLGSANALGQVVGATDPATAWLALDPESRASIASALCTVYLDRQPRGRRPSDRNPEKVAEWTEKMTSTIRIEWKGAP
ncbi:MAG: recombinase family protein [Nocardioidaceae bacterium]